MRLHLNRRRGISAFSFFLRRARQAETLAVRKTVFNLNINRGSLRTNFAIDICRLTIRAQLKEFCNRSDRSWIDDRKAADFGGAALRLYSAGVFKSSPGGFTFPRRQSDAHPRLCWRYGQSRRIYGKTRSSQIGAAGAVSETLPTARQVQLSGR